MLVATANAIAPALIAAEMFASNPKARPDLIPVGRFGKVEEVANTVLMLACNGHPAAPPSNLYRGGEPCEALTA